jgi:hypothetical protein
MPKGVVETQAQEKKWERAKDIAEKQGKGKRWPLIMHIFKELGGMSKVEGEDRNVLIERALERQGKKTVMPDEVHQVLHSWWNDNNAKKLTHEQHQALADIKTAKNKPKPNLKLAKARELEGLYGALSALRQVIAEDLRKDSKKSSSREWEMSKNHTPQEMAEMNKLIQEGYHPREAAHLVSKGLGGRGEPRDFMRALTSGVKPTMMSDKMMGEMRDVARQWLDNYHTKTAKYLEPEKNPIKHASAQMKAAHQGRSAKFDKEFSDFLASDELKGKSPMERHKAVQAWKTDWRSKNPEHDASIVDVNQAGKQFKESEAARRQHVDEIKAHLVHGGMPVESASGEEFESAPMTGRAVAEHMGLKQDEEGGMQYATTKDPAMQFAGAHKKFIESQLAPQVRAKQAQQAPAAPVAVSAEPKPAAPAEPAKAVIRRRASPEQVERMSRIDAAKMAEKKG